MKQLRALLLIGIVIAGAVLFRHFETPDHSKPWWKGAQSMQVCAVGQNANNYPGADIGNTVGCFSLSVTSDGNKVTNLVEPNGSNEFVQSTNCGLSSADNNRYCDFFDQQDKAWEVKK